MLGQLYIEYWTCADFAVFVSAANQVQVGIRQLPSENWKKLPGLIIP